MAPKRTNLIGNKYGRLIVIGFSHVSNIGHGNWHVRCVCGKNKVVKSGHLRSGKTRSCGCLRGEDHGRARAKPRAYRVWYGMKTRCYNKKVPEYKRYGGRGIKICERWMDIENFLEDMGESPKDMTIERINNDGDYEPGNCKWATQKEQHNNTRRNVILKYNGLSLTMVQWAERLNISRACLWARINEMNWPIEKALSLPKQLHGNKTIKT